jgi:hypothetical protein
MFGPEKEFLGINHTQLVSTSSGYVFETSNNRNPETIVNIEYNYKNYDYQVLISKVAPSHGDFRVLAETVSALILKENPLIQKIFMLVLYSPIDVEVTAPDGKRIGKDVVTGTTLNEISDALYSGPDAEHEFVIILDPLPGTYDVKTKGTGGGEYIIATGYGDLATTSVSSVSGTTTLNQIIDNTVILSSTSTNVVIEENTPPEPPEILTSETCVEDMQLAYTNGWIKKKSVYNALVADCKLLGILFAARDKTTNSTILKGILFSIKVTLDHMDRLAKDRSVTQEGKELIIKYTTWFREHKL